MLCNGRPTRVRVRSPQDPPGLKLMDIVPGGPARRETGTLRARIGFLAITLSRDSGGRRARHGAHMIKW